MDLDERIGELEKWMERQEKWAADADALLADLNELEQRDEYERIEIAEGAWAARGLS